MTGLIDAALKMDVPILPPQSARWEPEHPYDVFSVIRRQLASVSITARLTWMQGKGPPWRHSLPHNAAACRHETITLLDDGRRWRLLRTRGAAGGRESLSHKSMFKIQNQPSPVAKPATVAHPPVILFLFIAAITAFRLRLISIVLSAT